MTLDLVHPRDTLKVPVRTLVMKCNRFAEDPRLLCAPYTVRAPVSVDDFRQFVLALEDKDVEVTNANFVGLSLLCDDFGFVSLSERLLTFRQSADFKEVAILEDSEVRLRLSAQEERLLQRDHEFSALRRAQESTAAALVRLSRADVNVEQLAADVRALQSWRQSAAKAQNLLDQAMKTVTADVNTLNSAISSQQKQTQERFETHERSLKAADVRLSQVKADLDRLSGDLRNGLSALQRDDALVSLRSELALQSQAQESTAASLTEVIVRLSRIEAQFAHASPAQVSPPRVPETVRTTPPSAKDKPVRAPPIPKQSAAMPTPALGSAIVSDFPEIFAEFRGKHFSLLWRGGRDGFGGRDFHSRCDGHANTLTLIEDTKGNIFGGFTPLEWESREWNRKYGKESNRWKADPSLKSFIFTLKNPHNVPARRFALKVEEKDRAMLCHSERGPRFGCGADIGVSNNCNANTESWTALGSSYTNDTGLDTYAVFTGSKYFQVKEIEVFEITD
jgi:hypothetical protein